MLPLNASSRPTRIWQNEPLTDKQDNVVQLNVHPFRLKGKILTAVGISIEQHPGHRRNLPDLGDTFSSSYIGPPKASLLWHSGGEPMCSNTSKSYAGNSTDTGKVSLAGRVKIDDPNKKGCPGLPGWSQTWDWILQPIKSLTAKKLLTVDTKSKSRRG
jgi:hypothetical protein